MVTSFIIIFEIEIALYSCYTNKKKKIRDEYRGRGAFSFRKTRTSMKVVVLSLFRYKEVMRWWGGEVVECLGYQFHRPPAKHQQTVIWMKKNNQFYWISVAWLFFVKLWRERKKITRERDRKRDKWIWLNPNWMTILRVWRVKHYIFHSLFNAFCYNWLFKLMIKWRGRVGANKSI